MGIFRIPGMPIGGAQSAYRGGSASWHCGKADPPLYRMTDRCKNITLPQLRLRAIYLNFNNCFNHHTSTKQLHGFFLGAQETIVYTSI